MSIKKSQELRLREMLPAGYSTWVRFNPWGVPANSLYITKKTYILGLIPYWEQVAKVAGDFYSLWDHSLADVIQKSFPNAVITLDVGERD